MAKRRAYSAEFKLQVVLNLVIGRKTNAQFCQEHQLAPPMISDWKEQFLEWAPEIMPHPRAMALTKSGWPSWNVWQGD